MLYQQIVERALERINSTPGSFLRESVSGIRRRRYPSVTRSAHTRPAPRGCFPREERIRGVEPPVTSMKLARRCQHMKPLAKESFRVPSALRRVPNERMAVLLPAPRAPQA